MAWTGRDNFDSYTTGASINGGAGGSGWSANWVLNSGTANVETVVAGGMVGKALKLVSGVAGNASRTLTAESTGEAIYEVQASVVTAATDTHSVTLGANNIIGRLGITTAGSFEFYNATTAAYESVGTMSANTKHTIKVKYGHVADKFAVSFDGGAYGADKGSNGVLNVNKFDTNNTTADARDFWVDFITPPPVNYTYSTADTITPSDILTKFFGVNKIITETTTLSDIVSKTWLATKTSLDTITPTDTNTTQTNYLSSLLETLSLTDLATVERIILLDISDTLTPSDNISQLWAIVTNLTDTITPTDILTKQWITQFATLDAFTISDTLTKIYNSPITISEILNLQDLLSAQAGYPITITETTTLTDTLTSASYLFITAIDTLTPIDTLTKKLTFGIILTDNITLIDSLLERGAWGFQIKKTTSWTDETKNTSSWTFVPKT